MYSCIFRKEDKRDMGKSIFFIRNTILTVAFLLLIGFEMVHTDAMHNLVNIIDIIFEGEEQEDEKEDDENANTIEGIKLDDIADNIENLLPYHEELINLNGSMMRIAGVRSYYDQEFGINITRKGYIISRINWTSTDYEVEQMTLLKEYLDERGIKLLYVNEPAKYIDDDVYKDEFGGESYLNRNADLFLERIKEVGIGCIDLRDNIKEEGLDCFEMFYRSDHHWKVPTAKWAAKIIIEKLNEDYEYNIDTDLYADDNFSYVEYKRCWLGEQGRKVAESYVGLDDFTLVKPLYKTSFSRNMNDNLEEGDFDLFIDYSTYTDSYDKNGELEPAKLKGWHYSYNGNGYIRNNNADYGNVLILGDSYECNLIPFMALGIRDIYKIEPRYMNSGEVLSIIDKGDYDTVILAYAQFMIGAHDNRENANYKMFSFAE